MKTDVEIPLECIINELELVQKNTKRQRASDMLLLFCTINVQFSVKYNYSTLSMIRA